MGSIGGKMMRKVMAVILSGAMLLSDMSVYAAEPGGCARGGNSG